MKFLSRPISALVGVSLILSGASSVFAQETPTLSVALSSDPSSGTAPLSGVDLNATVGGTATGTISYRFYCDRIDNGTNVTGTPNREILNTEATSTNANDLCAYTLPGTYTGKVIVERAGLFAEARTTVTVAAAPVSPTLAVSLFANPASGYAPLSGVDLTATVTGTATGTTNYSFYCDRADNGTNVVGSTSASFLSSTALVQTAVDACSYASTGTYTGKVIVERAGLFAEARTTVAVTTLPATTTPATTTPPVMQKGEWKLEIGSAGKTLMRGHIESVTTDSIKVRTWGGVWTVRILSGVEVIPRPSAVLFDLNRFQPGDYVGINGTIVRDQPLTIDARVIRNWTEQREVKWEQKQNHEFLKRLIKDDRDSDDLTGRVFEGTVGTVSGSSFTVSDRGIVATINTSGATKLVNRNYSTIQLADIQPGHRVRIYGNVTAASTILAEVVRDTSLPIALSYQTTQATKIKFEDNKNKGNSNKNNNGKGNGRDD